MSVPRTVPGEPHGARRWAVTAVWWTGCLALTACATQDVGLHYTLTDHRETGLVAVALTVDGIPKTENPIWTYRNTADGSTGTLMTTLPETAPDWTHPRGRLAVFALPVGQYEFYRCRYSRADGGGVHWHPGGSGGVTLSNPSYSGLDAATYTSWNADPFSVKFEVVAGRLTYLGNLHVHWQWVAESGREQGEVSVLDQSVRDLPVLQQKLPNLKADEIRLRPTQ